MKICEKIKKIVSIKLLEDIFQTRKNLKKIKLRIKT